MKTTQRILGITLATLLSAAGGFAQSTPTTPPSGTPAGSSSTGTTNSGGVAPATGKPASTPTGPTIGGTGSGTTPPLPPTTTPPTTTPPTMMPPTTLPPTTTPPTTTPPATMPPTTMPPGPGNANPHTPNEHASDNAKAVQAVLMQFDAKRDQAIAARKALLETLHAATTDTERQTILAQLRTETQAQKDEQSALGKEIRDELKKLRDQRKSGGN